MLLRVDCNREKCENTLDNLLLAERALLKKAPEGFYAFKFTIIIFLKIY